MARPCFTCNRGSAASSSYPPSTNSEDPALKHIIEQRNLAESEYARLGDVLEGLNAKIKTDMQERDRLADQRRDRQIELRAFERVLTQLQPTRILFP